MRTRKPVISESQPPPPPRAVWVSFRFGALDAPHRQDAGDTLRILLEGSTLSEPATSRLLAGADRAPSIRSGSRPRPSHPTIRPRASARFLPAASRSFLLTWFITSRVRSHPRCDNFYPTGGREIGAPGEASPRFAFAHLFSSLPPGALGQRALPFGSFCPMMLPSVRRDHGLDVGGRDAYGARRVDLIVLVVVLVLEHSESRTKDEDDDEDGAGSSPWRSLWILSSGMAERFLRS